jgi:hypothetical protein
MRKKQLSASEIYAEYYKCIKDPAYGIETYMRTFDKTQSGFVPFKLFERQHEIVRSYMEHRFNIVAKPRQAGVSTTTAAFAAISVGTADTNNPENILILANKQDMAFEFLGKIKDFLAQLPRWFWGSEYFGSPEAEKKDIFIVNSKKEIKLPNGSRVKAVATSKDALRGFTPTWLIMDEAAFIDDGAEVFAAALTSLGTGGKAALISTPNGMDPLYYKTYEQSQSGDNDFNIIEMRWYEDPRYAKDLEWHKDDEVIKMHVQYDEDGKPIPVDRDECQRLIKEKYKPTSDWYRSMCRGMNNDSQKIAQELDVSFLGSGGNVIHDEYIEHHETVNVEEPKWVFGPEKDMWMWEEPIEGHEYIMGVDVARGDGADSSTIVILDVNTMTQVFEYKGKLAPDLLAQVAEEYGLMYNAYIVVDTTGGHGTPTVLKLLEFEYKNLHYDSPRNKVLTSKKNILTQYKKENDKIPGFQVGSVRIPMISHLEYMIRTDQVKIRSRRLTSEMKTFIYKNGRPDHMTGYHDDLLMALAMGLWVYQSSFTQLKKAEKLNQSMLSAWVMNTPNLTEDDKREQQRKKQRPKMAPSVSKNMQDPNGNYGWLFSKQR